MPPFLPHEDTRIGYALRGWPTVERPHDHEALLDRAEHHGLGGVVADGLASVGVVIDRAIVARELARELDHRAHLQILRDVDRAFANAGLVAVPLKGVFLGERYYPRPASRVTGDTDLLVRVADLAAASRALESLGYVAATGPDEARFRDEHHHLHFAHPRALPLELHFHAYRGFGRTFHSEPLLQRSGAFRDYAALRVLAAEDELVYLAVHAAAHKFGRLSWLFDLRLLVETLGDDSLAAAARRAVDLGFGPAVSLAARLLVSVFGMDRQRLAPLTRLAALRVALAERFLSSPAHPSVRAASRLIYTTALCSDARTSVRWTVRELGRRGRGLGRAA